MKRLLVVVAVAAGVVGMAMVAGAGTDRVNWCTSTYELTGQAAAGSGSDSAIVTMQTVPVVNVVKYAKNLRTGIENVDQVNAISGDTIEFKVYWWITGEADAETVVLNDYVPTGLNFDSLVAGDTINNGSKIDYTESGGLVQYSANGVGGEDSGVGTGEFKFTATVN